MSYQLKIDPKSRFSARFMSKIQSIIQNELVDSGLTQQEVANILNLNRSVINRRLSSDANLTSRSIAEFAFAFEKDIELKFVDRNKVDRANHTQVGHPMVDLTKNETSPAGYANKINNNHYMVRTEL